MSRLALSLSLSLGVAVAAACGGPKDHQAAPTTSGPSASVASVTPASLVFEPLAWDLPEQEAQKRLQAAGMAPRADEIRGYFSTPGQPHAAPGPISHTVEPVILFTPRPGWTGSARYATVGGALVTIELTASLSAVGARAELTALEKRLGPPDDRRTFPGSGAGGTLRLIWVRGGVWLVASAGDEGHLSIRFNRDSRPASAIGP